jgi:triosephosphate isomerase (TIM)
VPQVISESDVRAARLTGILRVPEGALVTPLAREAAARLGVALEQRPRAPRSCVVLGNWKMNLDLGAAVRLLQGLATRPELAACGCEVGVMPPHPYLMLAAALLEGTSISVGAQDLSAHAGGAYTGEVSARMLRAFCKYVLVGHSERRQQHAESSELVWNKARAALAGELSVVVCVGESAHERERGRMPAVLREQLGGLGRAVPAEAAERLVIAYEPVWAIGTGKRAAPEQVGEAHREIRRLLESALGEPGGLVPILYGGSVQPDGAAELARLPGVDGFLVGGASLDDGAFSAIAQTFLEKST